MKRFLWVLVLTVSVVLAVAPLGMAAETVIYEASDPVGDENGPGTYTYPTNPAFEPFKGLFDMTNFKVSHDENNVYFDTTFVEITNPWSAPEGSSHTLINIYIDTTPNQGRTDTINEGAFVTFDPKHAWDVNVKGIGWNGSRVFFYTDEPGAPGISDGVKFELLPDGKTMRITVPKSVIGEPKASWKYYVLIGSQDGYGPDNYRPVNEKAGEWVLGGGSDLNFEPNVVDILAPAEGKYSQKAQLGSWKEDGTLAVVYPANMNAGGALSPALIAVIVAVVVVLVLLLVFILRRPGKNKSAKA